MEDSEWGQVREEGAIQGAGKGWGRVQGETVPETDNGVGHGRG